MVKIERYAASGTWDSPKFAQAIKVTGAQTILFISGQVAWTDDSRPAHAGDFKAQAHAAFGGLKAQIEAGGGTMANLVKLNIYLTDSKYAAEYRAIRGEYMDRMPAATSMIVQALSEPDWLIEVEGIAVL